MKMSGTLRLRYTGSCCSSVSTTMVIFGLSIGILFVSNTVGTVILRVGAVSSSQSDQLPGVTLTRSSVDDNAFPRLLLHMIIRNNSLHSDGRRPNMHPTKTNATMCFDNVPTKTTLAADNITISSDRSTTNHFANSITTDIQIDDAVATEPTTSDDVCRVYMAPSTIPGAGYGLFAGISFQPGDVVTPGDGVVPIHNPVFHNGNNEHENTFLWDEYVWSASTFSAMDLLDEGMDGASFGIGALPNCYFALLNVADSDSHGRDYANLESMDSPGIGAFSPWYDRKSHATKHIHVGSELYVDYGYAYFETRTETIGYVPFLNDYKHADRLLQKLTNVTTGIYKNNRRASTATRTEMSEELYQLSRSILDAWPNQILRALPENSTMVPNVLQHGGTIRKDYLRSIRNIDYLKTFGACMDHLYVATSKLLPHAGRGVYTSRSFTKGSIVTTVPLIHIPDRKVMTMFGESKFHNGYIPEEPIRNETNPIHQQLLLNYCFGHAQSTLLLCPYGIVSSLINHAPIVTMDGGVYYEENAELQQQRNSANVQIQWSTKMTKNPAWWDMNITQWAYVYGAGLAFEYVALRDIDMDEEILIDYGPEWQSAWEKHVANWQPTHRFVDVLNTDIDSIIPSNEEWVWPNGDINTNPKAVNLWCYDIYRTFQGLTATEEVAYPCRVIHRLSDHNKKSYMYTAEIIERRQNIDDTVCDEVFDEILWSLPRDAFAYGGCNEMYDTNQYLLTKTFRHEIGIPDMVMPRTWKNKPANR